MLTTIISKKNEIKHEVAWCNYNYNKAIKLSFVVEIIMQNKNADLDK